MFCPAVVAATHNITKCKEKETLQSHYYNEKEVEDLMIILLEKVQCSLQQLGIDVDIHCDHLITEYGISCRLQKDGKFVGFNQCLEE